MTPGKLLVWEPAEGFETELESGSVVAKTRMVLGAIPKKVFPADGLARVGTKVIAPVAKPAGGVDTGRAETDGSMFYGSHAAMHELLATLPRIAACDIPVLIQGETGTGKEVVARQIHKLSPRAHRPFVKLNCAAVPAELAESELFGYERGAFTGAHQRKPGIFEMANGGTVMLDEIGDMEFRLQAKLLQVLQDQEFRRVGGTETVKVDVRVISATHRDLREAGRENSFRMDLFYRLNGFAVTVPSLRQRRGEVLQLAEFLFRRHAGLDEEMPLSPALEQAFLNHDWPGNIRELEMTVRKLAVLGDADLIARQILEHSESRFANPQGAGPVLAVSNDGRGDAPPAGPTSIIQKASRAQQETEAHAIRSALQASRWNRKQAATLLGIDYKALLYKMKKLGIQ